MVESWNDAQRGMSTNARFTPELQVRFAILTSGQDTRQKAWEQFRPLHAVCENRGPTSSQRCSFTSLSICVSHAIIWFEVGMRWDYNAS